MREAFAFGVVHPSLPSELLLNVIPVVFLCVQHGRTALIEAAKNGHITIVSALLEAKAALAATDEVVAL